MVISELEFKRIEKKFDMFFSFYTGDKYFYDCSFSYKFDKSGVTFYECGLNGVVIGEGLVRAEYNCLDRNWYLKQRGGRNEWFEYEPLPKVSEIDIFLEELRMFINNRIILKMCD